MKKNVRSMLGLCLLMLGTTDVSAQVPLAVDESSPTCTVFNDWDGKEGETCTILGISPNGNYSIGYIESSVTGVLWDRKKNEVTEILSPYGYEGVDSWGNPAGFVYEGAYTYDVSDNGTVVGAFKDEAHLDKYGFRACYAPGYRTTDGTWKRVPILTELLSGSNNSGHVVKISRDGTVMGGYIKAADESGMIPAIWKDGELQTPTITIEGAKAFEMTAMSDDGKVWAGIKIDKKKTHLSSYTSVLYDGNNIIEIAGTKPDETYKNQTLTTVNSISLNGKYACGHFYAIKPGEKEGDLPIVHAKGYIYDVVSKKYTWIDNFIPSVVMNDGTMFGRDREDRNLSVTGPAIAQAYVDGELKNFFDYIKETYVTTSDFDGLESSRYKISNITDVTEWENGRCTIAGYVEYGGFEPARSPFILTLEKTSEKVANLKALKDGGVNEELPYYITGEVLITNIVPTMTGGKRVYISDETAAMIIELDWIEAEEFEFQVGDKIKNLKAYYMEALQFVSAEKISGNNELNPLNITIPELNMNIEANMFKLISIDRALLAYDEENNVYNMIQKNDSAIIGTMPREDVTPMQALVGKYVSFVGNVEYVDEKEGNAVLLRISLEEYNDPVPAYGFKMGETFSFASFDLYKPATLKSLADLGEIMVVAGAGVNDTYYAASDRGWGAGATNGSFYTVNTETGEVTSLGATISKNMSDMTFDYTTATMFGLSMDPMNGTHTLSKMKLTDGTLSTVADFEIPIGAIACDAEGQMYGIGSMDGKLYKVDKTNATLIEVGATGIIPGYSRASMDFDHATGKLYWTYGKDEELYSYSVLNSIDVSTGVATEICSYENEEALLIALYIPSDLEPQWPDKTFADLQAMKKAGQDVSKYVVNGEVLVTGVRTSDDVTTFFVQDETAAIAVNYTGETKCPYKSGDKLKDLKGKLIVADKVHSFDFVSATVVSTENDVIPASLTIAEINAGYPDNEAKFIKIDDATVSKRADGIPMLSQGDNNVLTHADKMILDFENQLVEVTGHIESANEEGIVILSLVSTRKVESISALQSNNFYCNNSEVVAEGAAHIEIYDIAGCKVASSDTGTISVKGMNSMIVAKAFYTNGEVKISKFVVK